MNAINTFLSVTLATCILTSCSTEYHVATTGLDSNPGSDSKPFKTISAAAAVAQPGDVVTVHEGVYREWVNPPRGGKADNQRIVYQAAEGEKAKIRGSELVKDWVHYKGSVWKRTIDNNFFGSYNPYKDIIFGDWFFPGNRLHHTGEVFLNEKSLYEKATLEEVLNPIKEESREGSEFTWYCQSDAINTYLYANFQQYDNNEEKVEINVRQACFYPKNTGVNYITVRGFFMTQAATQWAPPTAEQIGIIGTNWSKGWIIENNVVSNSRCTGITLGKDRASGNNVGDPADNGRVPDGVNLYNDVVDKCIKNGWNKELIGSHIVRNNEIFDCGQAGICGSLGAIFSEISNNHIHDIYTKRQFSGFEMGGIKIHGAVDMVIADNLIHNAHKGIWLDWMAQGTRISRNILFDNENKDLYLEVNHGPVLVDNNLLLSRRGILSISTGSAYVHNLVTGRAIFTEEERTTPVFKPHGTEKTGLSEIPGGDDRCYNNIFAGEGLARLAELKLPVYVNGNVYLNGAKRYQKEQEFVEDMEFNPEIRLEREEGELWLHMIYDAAISNLKNPMVTTELLGTTDITKQKFEMTGGSPLKIDSDFFGEKRNRSNPVAGPFEIKKTGRIKLKIR